MMKKKKKFGMAALLLGSALCTLSCGNKASKQNQGSTHNPVEELVARAKKSDTALLLCTFGSTYGESLKTYDAIVEDYQKAFPGTDVYLSFTSRICVNRAKAATGIDRYQPDLWLSALGKAKYDRVIVQSLHVITGEEYLSLMNTDVKKNFMITDFPKVKVLKGSNLLAEEENVEAVAEVLYGAYEEVLSNKKNILLFMGHGNPETAYIHANMQYSLLEKAMSRKTAHDNVFVGTVDCGSMLFFPEVEKGQQVPADNEVADTYIYKKLRNYCRRNNLKESEVTVHLAAVMSIAGNHAHNDLWGWKEDDADVNEATPWSDYSWRLKLQKMGFKIDETESHHGSVDQCNIKGLGDYAAIRALWVEQLKKIYDNEDAWTTGEDYQ